VAWDWVIPAGSAVVGAAGLLFGWASTVRGQRQTAELAREGNRHAQALAESAGEQSRRLEEVRFEQAGRERRERRLEESYLEIATTVIRLSAVASPDGDVLPPDDSDELVRARVLVGLFALPDVREAFERWMDRFDKLRFAQARRSATDETPPTSTRDLQSPRDMWRRQSTDARLREIDARERLIEAMSRHLGRPGNGAPFAP
jgi:hypothetical protein